MKDLEKKEEIPAKNFKDDFTINHDWKFVT